MIVDGTISAYSRLIQEQLDHRLGVSRAPVRDALGRLAHERLVTRIPGNGYTRAPYMASTTPISRAAIRQCCDGDTRPRAQIPPSNAPARQTFERDDRPPGVPLQGLRRHRAGTG